MRDDGVRRLDDPADYVRREIELALEADTLLVPVLVEGAAVPAVICAVAIILAEYDPLHSAFELGLAALVAGLIAALALSAPLWIGWRLVGATRHYAKILALLLYRPACCTSRSPSCS